MKINYIIDRYDIISKKHIGRVVIYNIKITKVWVMKKYVIEH